MSHLAHTMHTAVRPDFFCDVPSGRTGESDLHGRFLSDFGFDFYWLREVTRGTLDGELGIRMPAITAARLSFRIRGVYRWESSVIQDGRLRLVIRKSGEQLGVRMYCVTDPPDDATSDQLLEALVAGDPALSRDALLLRRRIYTAAGEALSRYCSVEIASRLARIPAGGVLLDWSFPFDEPGIAAFRRMEQGDLTGVLDGQAHGVPREGGLTGFARSRKHLELYLPFLERKCWRRRAVLLGGMQADADCDGRILVRTAGSQAVKARNSCQAALLAAGPALPGQSQPDEPFSLCYCRRQEVAAPEAPVVLWPLLEAYGFGPEASELLAAAATLPGSLRAEITLRISGEAAAAWRRLTHERTLAFYHAFARVSLGIQRAMRLWLPYVYFHNVSRYDDLELAWPLVVYQASKPYSRRARSEFTYEPMNPRSVALALRHAARSMSSPLGRVHERLVLAGKVDVAARYCPSRGKDIVAGVKRDPRRFKRLLAGDAFLMRELVKLGNHCRELRLQQDKEPDAPIHHLSVFLESFLRPLHRRLRRFYGGQDFIHFGSLVFVEATRALSTALGPPAPIEAVLRLRLPGEEADRIFVNGGFRAAHWK